MCKRRLTTLGLVALGLLLMLTGCFGGAKEKSISLTVAGSTSIQPLMEELAKDYHEKNNQVRILVQGGGSSAGIKSVTAGSANIGMSSRPLKESEKKGLKIFTIAQDGIAVIVHDNNQLEGLSLTQAADIFSGKITNWQEVGGPDKKIVVVTREEGSGTRGAFEEIVMGDTKIKKDAITQNTTGSVHQTVAQDEAAIGYISIGNLDDKVEALKIDGVKAEEENVKAGTYKIARPFLLISQGEPTGEMKSFIDWILSIEGQKIVADDYISVH